jgi:hypothetical protein
MLFAVLVLVLLGVATPFSAVVFLRRRAASRAWDDELASAFARDKAIAPLGRPTLGATRAGSAASTP